jgi:transcriptional regulator with XRE-family HTH domain
VIFNAAALTGVRKIRGLSKSELALRAGKSRPYITQLEGNDRNPSRKAVDDLSRALEVEDSSVFYVEPTVEELLRELQIAHSREAAS